MMKPKEKSWGDAIERLVVYGSIGALVGALVITLATLVFFVGVAATRDTSMAAGIVGIFLAVFGYFVLYWKAP